MEINEALVKKLLDTVDAGLTSGVGEPVPGQMCVEAAISYALGEPHSDGPSCVEPAVRAGKIRLNDAVWSSNEARAKGMRRIAIAQLGSEGVVDGQRYATRLAEKTIRVIVPIALRAAATRVPAHHASALEEAAVRCESEGNRTAARAAAAAAYTADAAADDAAYTAAYAAYDAAAAAAAERDRILSISAGLMEEALRECGSPGCDWLWLCDGARGV